MERTHIFAVGMPLRGLTGLLNLELRTKVYVSDSLITQYRLSITIGYQLTFTHNICLFTYIERFSNVVIGQQDSNPATFQLINNGLYVAH